MNNSRKTYYSIGEVCDLTHLEPHVLRYWENEFPQLHPKKNRAGNRAYREKDIDTILYIKHLLYEEKFTIPGAKKKLRSEKADKPANNSKSVSSKDENSTDKLKKMLSRELKELLSVLRD